MSKIKIDKSLNVNIQEIESRFKDFGDLVKSEISTGQNKDIKLYMCYIDMLVDRSSVEFHVIEHFMMQGEKISQSKNTTDIINALKTEGIATIDQLVTSDFQVAIDAILGGDTPIFINGCEEAIIISTKGWPNRGVPTTDTEVVVQGSKEAFSEVFRINSMLIRRRIKDSRLKLQQMQIGKRSKTDVGIMYMEDIVRPSILADVLSRLKDINIDAILDIGYVEQFIEDNKYSPFPQCQITERPDKAASALLEGRIVIIVDNSPYGLIVPTTINTFFQSSEDYYQRFEIMSFIRFLRYMAGIIAVTLPALYLATALYHPSMVPMELIFKMAEARSAVPFPAVLEIIAMEIAFELLREAGLRLPGPIGSTMGIVGGIIIGQAAVDAGLVSPIVVIIVALTGICGFAIPNHSLTSAFNLSKFALIILASFLGLYGFWIGLIILLIHLVSIRSFGIPYLYPFVSWISEDTESYKDTIFRFPLTSMKDRPIFARNGNLVRLKHKKIK